MQEKSLATASFSILPPFSSMLMLISRTFLFSLSFLRIQTFGLLTHLFTVVEPPPPSTPPVGISDWPSAILAGSFSEYLVFSPFAGLSSVQFRAMLILFPRSVFFVLFLKQRHNLVRSAVFQL
jgi:hypothetical protein